MEIKASAYIVDIAHTEATRGKEAATSATRSSASSGAGTVRSLDRVELSGGAPDLKKLNQALAALPDVRLDRVALAKQRLQGGGYQVDGRDLAQKMMESLSRG